MKSSVWLFVVCLLCGLLNNSITCFRYIFHSSFINYSNRNLLQPSIKLFSLPTTSSKYNPSSSSSSSNNTTTTTITKPKVQSNGYHFATRLYELKLIDKNDIVSLRKRLQSIVNEYITISYSCRYRPQIIMNSYAIGKAFVSIQHLSMEQLPELKTIVTTLLQTIPDKGFDCRTIASILTGLKSSSCDNNEVRQVLQYIVTRLRGNQTILVDGLDMKTLSTMIRAMKSFPLDTKEVYQINEAICDALDTIELQEDNNRQLSISRSAGRRVSGGLRFTTGEEIASMMIGLSNRNSDHPLTRRLLIHIASFLNRSSSSSSSNQYPSIQEESSVAIKSQNTVYKKPEMIDTNQMGRIHDIREHHIASMLYGLQGVHFRPNQERLSPSNSSSNSNSNNNISYIDAKYEWAVKTILSSFSGIISNSFTGQLTAESIGTSLYGKHIYILNSIIYLLHD